MKTLNFKMTASGTPNQISAFLMANLLKCHRCGYVAFEKNFYHFENGEESVFCPNCPDYKDEFNSVSELHPNDIKKLTDLNYERYERTKNSQN